ncbi:4-hydroxythreonine-4-phosphate dehydrogenase PdxA [[Eubacterium] cellulosolvens]
MTDNFKPIIALTMGDAAGVGPEIIVKTLYDKKIYEICRPLVIGDLKVLMDILKIAKIDLAFNPLKEASEARFQYGRVDILDLNNIKLEELIMGRPQAMAGKASVEYLEKAIELALAGGVHAITTAPLNKEAMNKAGYTYPGHTEILAKITQTKDFAMMLVAKNLRVIHVTTHVSMRTAISLIKKNKVLATIRLAYKAMRGLGIKKPKIAVAGLNPHAGEAGIFGQEEINEITPAIDQANKEGIQAKGPFPPDTVFLRAKKNEFDIVVAMYHDQGHIPIKLEGFESGVNVTIGLPIIRTSVDHGTAYRRAGLRLGTADPMSLIEAIKLAVIMAREKFKG